MYAKHYSASGFWGKLSSLPENTGCTGNPPEKKQCSEVEFSRNKSQATHSCAYHGNVKSHVFLGLSCQLL